MNKTIGILNKTIGIQAQCSLDDSVFPSTGFIEIADVSTKPVSGLRSFDSLFFKQISPKLSKSFGQRRFINSESSWVQLNLKDIEVARFFVSRKLFVTGFFNRLKLWKALL